MTTTTTTATTTTAGRTPTTEEELAGQTVELLQALIRNACVNDGTVGSGQEVRNAETIADFLDGAGLDLERVEPQPGRTSLVTRVHGTAPDAPSLGLVGHTDVVPVEPDGWSRDPFGAELVDGWVWGRGAIDMLGLTAAYAVVTRALATSGRPPRGDLLLAAVADEEHGSVWGVDWLTTHRWDLVQADHVLTESGGVPVGPLGARTLAVGEKGGAGRLLRVHGRPGHGSGPWGGRNAIVIAAEVVRRIAAARGPVVVGDLWRRYVDALAPEPDLRAALLDPERLDDALPRLGALGAVAHATTHTTLAPTVIGAGSKPNVIPGLAEITLDIRVLPGTRPGDVEALLTETLGDLTEHVDIVGDRFGEPSLSPTDTDLYRVIERTVTARTGGAPVVPTLGTGGTDGRFYRRRGVPAYGFGLLSAGWDPGTWRGLFHGNDERVDVASLELTTAALHDVVTTFLR
ncbi:M20/M25/M40 family metallo-hydrolase [Krasilnikoviella flava]|uniref:Acetylornithine deacetylase/Succinyl-diaminopimelate desuccinylase n=1 Tax=Krasilnikoviella flava TaxID=526729 RepID=A0A1T5L7E8_9MICO|nr:M20/M25/M40 family metallo-hydrolase [Krasilnikoviella flava]SKC71863.1 Acetylornithine deacetylase/Succinyl-diaminopimelate desuccinylase [Krasilnikoviella flava]